jgi:hypothetical protein
VVGVTPQSQPRAYLSRATGPAAAGHVALHRQPPEGTPGNVWSGTADTLEAIGDRVRVRVTGTAPVVAEVTVHPA